MRKQEEISEAKLKEAEQENSKLKEELEELWTGLSLEKKIKRGFTITPYCLEEGIRGRVHRSEEGT